MENYLEIVLHKILPDNFVLNENSFIRAHECKSHLKKDLPFNKLSTFQA